MTTTGQHHLDQPSRVELRPRYEGTNIGVWIGFKHVNYLVEEAVLGHLRQAGHPVGETYLRYGLCVDVVHIETRILHAVRIDDLVSAEVRPVAGAPGVLALAVVIDVVGGAARSVSAKVRVVFRRDPAGSPAEPVPAALEPYTVDRLGTAEAVPLTGEDALSQLTEGQNAFGWRWVVPYFYCHFTERLQMSGYLRVMEEVVHLFLADRGVSVKALLDEKAWIPAVPRSSITILDEARMEEELITVLTVEEVFKTMTYTARMDCYVVRDGRLLPTATGRITHGYAQITSRSEWSLVDFDDWLVKALSAAPAGVVAGRGTGR